MATRDFNKTKMEATKASILVLLFLKNNMNEFEFLDIFVSI
ncbi:hypothetical protein X275_10775 [Marinitoga sp. 1197]|nr:hypothetical protein [Marinitoga sp. 1197]KLO21134.1 hypothetical protein X275_10775 [Marinitoga sp. 1197]